MLVSFETTLASDAPHYHLFYNQSDFYCNLHQKLLVVSSDLYFIDEKKQYFRGTAHSVLSFKQRSQEHSSRIH